MLSATDQVLQSPIAARYKKVVFDLLLTLARHHDRHGGQWFTLPVAQIIAESRLGESSITRGLKTLENDQAIGVHRPPGDHLSFRLNLAVLGGESPEVPPVPGTGGAVPGTGGAVPGTGVRSADSRDFGFPLVPPSVQKNSRKRDQGGLYGERAAPSPDVRSVVAKAKPLRVVPRAKSHGGHAWCDARRGRCVPRDLHAEFCLNLGVAPEVADRCQRQWYRSVVDRLPPGPIVPVDLFRFWKLWFERESPHFGPPPAELVAQPSADVAR